MKAAILLSYKKNQKDETSTNKESRLAGQRKQPLFEKSPAGRAGAKTFVTAEPGVSNA
jgi:hypothetical protein